MKLLEEFHNNYQAFLSRRQFLRHAGLSIGAIALGSFLGCEQVNESGQVNKTTHFPAKAKRVIFIHMAGAPSQL